MKYLKSKKQNLKFLKKNGQQSEPKSKSRSKQH